MIGLRVDGAAEIRELEIDISLAPARVKRNATKVLRRAAELVDEQMTIDAAGHQGNWFGIPGTEYDTPLEKHVSHELLDPLTAEIGIENKGAGKLAHFIVFGAHKAHAPAYDYTAAQRRSTPAIVRMFADAGEESVLGDD